MRKVWLLAISITAACLTSSCSSGEDRKPPAKPAPTVGATSPAGTGSAADAAAPAVSCEAPIPVYEAGKVARSICPEQVAAAGLTVVDLSEHWAPRVLAGEGPEATVPYRADYLRLARNDIPAEDERWRRARHDRFFELYGVFPTPALVRKRLLDEERHRCHDAVDKDGLEKLKKGLDTWRPKDEWRGDLATIEFLRKKLEKAAKLHKKSDIEELKDDKRYSFYLERYHELNIRARAIAQMQAHYQCEGLLDKFMPGVMGSPTVEALHMYHRRHMIVSWQLDDETRKVLLTDSRELDFRTLLRSLRERVTDATGLIEDGTAAAKPGEIAGRIIDAKVFIDDARGDALDNAAPDLIAAATDAAARALGWTGPKEAIAQLEEPPPAKVAIKLPKPPAYHSEHMDLQVVIDRGDVWYDFPFAPNGDRYAQPRERRPALLLYVTHEGKRIPLTRWPTTVGGWQPERLFDDTVKLAYKESPAGKRIYRDVVAAPRWIPPASTPNRDLVRPIGKGHWELKYDTFGPSYASAYGIVMMIHHRVDKMKSGEVQLTDQGVRAHGSANYASILEGFSHGCHRLHNHRAVRLSGFLLGHRKHEVRGPIPLNFTRNVYWRQRKHKLHFESRGYRYELTPPVEVDVLRGRIFGRSPRPLLPRPLTRPMLKRYQ